MIIKLIYTLFLGIILAAFVGVGVSTFYPEPEWPQTPEAVEKSYYEDEPSEESKAAQKLFDEELKAYEEEMQDYNRNASIILLSVAILFLAIGVIQAHKIDVLADGVLLGGIFTFIYGVGRGVAGGDEMFRFVIITIGLIAALGLGYWRFAKPNQAPPTAKPSSAKRKP